MNSPLRPEASALSVTVTDTPPMGVTVLSFEVSVTGATRSIRVAWICWQDAVPFESK